MYVGVCRSSAGVGRSSVFAPCAKAGGSINFQLSLGVGHPILLRKHAHILSIKKSNLKLLFSKFC